jgi:hypothetical protein
MSNRNVAITGGPNNTEAMVTGQQELLVRVNSAASTANSNVTIVGPLGTQSSTSSVAVTLSNDQAKLGIIPHIIISSGDAATVIIASSIMSISFASNGTADALISFDGGVNYVAIPTGTTINLDAGGIMNLFVQDTFAYDTDTNSGASLIITYNALV